jgi:hypothetical protein
MPREDNNGNIENKNNKNNNKTATKKPPKKQTNNINKNEYILEYFNPILTFFHFSKKFP